MNWLKLFRRKSKGGVFVYDLHTVYYQSCLRNVPKGMFTWKIVFKLTFLPTVEPREKTKRRHGEKEKAPSHGGRPQKSKVD